jgi:4-azaleucine resistance transporter AzlC
MRESTHHSTGAKTAIRNCVHGYLAGIRDAAPVILGYTAIGLAFGVVARTAGITVCEVALMSLVLYAGSAQFVLVGLIAAGMPASAIIVTIFLVNIRHVLYSAAVSPHVRHLRPWQNALIGAELTDETFAVASGRLGQDPVTAGAGWFFGLNNASHLTWFLCTTAGALAGSVITDIRALGFDFALGAMFAALLVLQIAGRQTRLPAVAAASVGALVALVGTLVVPASWAIVAATIIAATVGMVAEEKAGPA